ncbi:MAG: helicase, superfamily [Eubacterium sp.]|jgi:ATP-dependent RNA helicase RhlE|nr:helicase, superfamily [Eubacterium sp.]
MIFKDLNLIEPILKAIEYEKYETPTPIQEQAIPPILDQRDLLGCAQTGTGKTAAFAMPIIQLLCTGTFQKKAGPIRTLVLTPTRELAMQIMESFAAYGRFTSLKYCVIFGGVAQKPQTDQLKSGVDILIATPGRLLDLINQKYIDLSNIKYFVLDEADRMLDMGFGHDVKRIIKLLPQKRQTLLFSATMPGEIAQLADSLLTDPVKVSVTPVSSTVDIIAQSVYFVEKKDKRDLLIHLLKDRTIDSVLVFTRTKHGADRVAKTLVKAGIKTQAIHGDKSQGARQIALNSFKEKKIRVLVATDIAARGIDVERLSHVINFDLPDSPETYVHRIGRTGRAGQEGVSISFCDEEEKKYLKGIEKLIAKNIPVIEKHLYSVVNSTPVPASNTDRSITHRKPKQKGNSDRPVRSNQSDEVKKSRVKNYSQFNTRNRKQTNKTVLNNKVSEGKTAKDIIIRKNI